MVCWTLNSLPMFVGFVWLRLSKKDSIQWHLFTLICKWSVSLIHHSFSHSENICFLLARNWIKTGLSLHVGCKEMDCLSFLKHVDLLPNSTYRGPSHIVQWGSHKILSKAKTSYHIINLNQIVFILFIKLFSWNRENSPSGAPAVQIYPSNSCWHIFLFIY